MKIVWVPDEFDIKGTAYEFLKEVAMQAEHELNAFRVKSHDPNSIINLAEQISKVGKQLHIKANEALEMVRRAEEKEAKNDVAEAQ